MKKIGIIGLGNIGGGIATAILEGAIPNAQLRAVLGRTEPPGLAALRQSSANPIDYYDDFEKFITADIDLVVEAANPAAVRAYGKKILSAGRDFMMMSVGGLIDPGFLDALAQEAEKTGAVIYIPAGAVTGLNIAAAGVIAGLEEAVIRSTKNPTGLKDAPYIKNNNIALDALTEPTLVFRGNVFDAVKHFPQNVNIAAAMALSGFGPEKTMVEMIADPKATVIQQEIWLKGKFGEMKCELKLLPSPNKRSSYLALLGAIAALKKYTSPIKLGY
ncbi:probable L-aspartate dehydrogenase [Treponema primitia ZAS-2]|uniref:L-aspartate dehydrogenase n=1 Tax=Treponema primitia (strain ATCC BAA-887 / DSM 12427 / ZAS-2) TaxID=545694 RepID=F5YI60_TREPZ|nr:aspartate dehydrogenase domain-containing protein [Treponema primitia]AEF85849.1 probable L-aspartate dehydrogenase [Treponema primitia ZAS-2]